MPRTADPEFTRRRDEMVDMIEEVLKQSGMVVDRRVNCLTVTHDGTAFNIMVTTKRGPENKPRW